MKDFSKILTSLSDLSFKDLITPRIIKLLYVLGSFVSLFFVIIQVADAFHASDGRGVWALFFSPILLLFYLLMIRVFLETITVAFRAAEKAGGSETIGNTQQAAKVEIIPTSEETVEGL